MKSATMTVALLAAMALLVGGCGGSDDGAESDAATDAASTGNGEADGGGDLGDAEPDASAAALYDELTPELQEFFDLINEERVAEGLDEVTLRADLICAAKLLSDDAGDQESCSTEGSDGSRTGQRVAACDGIGWSVESIGCEHLTPRATVDSWLSDAEQRDIMLGDGRTYVGVGVYNNYWTATYDD